MAKSTIEEIRRRFDAEVERFSSLETGQSAAIDAPLALELVTVAAASVTPHAVDVVGVGCGAGNDALKLLEKLPNVNVMLVDLSQPMLDRAVQRLRAVASGLIESICGDNREVDLGHALSERSSADVC